MRLLRKIIEISSAIFGIPTFSFNYVIIMMCI